MSKCLNPSGGDSTLSRSYIASIPITPLASLTSTITDPAVHICQVILTTQTGNRLIILYPGLRLGVCMRARAPSHTLQLDPVLVRSIDPFPVFPSFPNRSSNVFEYCPRMNCTCVNEMALLGMVTREFPFLQTNFVRGKCRDLW